LNGELGGLQRGMLFQRGLNRLVEIRPERRQADSTPLLQRRTPSE
jgi:hypothetical protein